MKINFSVFCQSKDAVSRAGETYQFWLVLHGNGTLCSAEGSFPFSSHDVLELPPHIPFEIRTEGEPVEFGRMELLDFITTNAKINHILHRDTDLIRKTFFYALELRGMKLPHYAAIMDNVNRIMLDALLSTNLTRPSSIPCVVAVLEDINEHFRDSGYDLNRAVARTGYSASHFRKLFHREVGLPPLAFINQRRIEYATNLMNQRTGLTLREIAAQSGFADAYYFSRVFKKMKGISPTEYMRRDS